MPRNHIAGSVCAWLLASNRISVVVRMGESKPDASDQIRVDANRVCGLFQRIRNRVWTWPKMVKATCRLLTRAGIDDCHWRLNSITTTKKMTTLQHDFTNLYRLHYSRHYRVLPRNVVIIRQLNSTARKRNRNYLPDPKTLNGAKPDANWVSNFPSRPLKWLKPKYYRPSDTHWQEYGLRPLYLVLGPSSLQVSSNPAITHR